MVNLRSSEAVRILDAVHQIEMLKQDCLDYSVALTAYLKNPETLNNLTAIDTEIRMRASFGRVYLARIPELAEQTLAVQEELNRFEAKLEAIGEPPFTGIAAETLAVVAKDTRELGAFLYGRSYTAISHQVQDQQSMLQTTSWVISGLSVILMIGGLVVLVLVFWIRQKNQALEALATTDPLTGLLNRRAAVEQGEVMLELAKRTAGALSLCIIDLDHFKAINDTHGHPIGDAVLVAVADCLRKTKRNTDIVARLGGEEFIVIMPDTPTDGATTLAERVREAIAGLTIIPPGESVIISPKASIGLATTEGGVLEFPALYHRADLALYRAKSAGRNRVVVAEHGSFAV